MSAMRRKSWIAPALAATLLCSPAPSRAQDLASAYAGKTISLVIGSAAGGIYDLGGRLFATYLQKYIPGNPTVVPRNMPGASSEVAAQFLSNVAPHDGLTLGTLQPTIVLDKILDPALHYDPEGFVWIGRVQPLVFVGVGWRASGVDSFADARKRTVIVSAQGASGISAVAPFALNRLGGAHFRVITGYESQGPAFIAMEHGEVQGIGSAALTDVLKNKDWTQNHRVSFLYAITAKRTALEPDAPAIPELAQNEGGRQALTLLGRGQDVGQMILTPPGVPPERVDILRKAFDSMVKDTTFIEQAKALGIYVDPLNGADLTSLVRSVDSADASVLQLLREAAQPQP